MATIALVNPRFEPSYWGLEYALPLLGKRANLPVACLPLLAALVPNDDYSVTIFDENVAELDFDRLAQFDIVGLTGMSVQRQRLRQILEQLKQRNVFTVVGGPWVTVKEEYFGDLADVIFVGEAEQTWPTFLREWPQRTHQRRYEQSEKTDMTTVPCPRYDLLNTQAYLFGSLQISRGCPFQCEFCDIIVTFGRRPRLKSSAQVITELEAMRAQKMTIAFIVDDNLIGNKRAIKPILQDIARWQQRRGYPFAFFAEASLDLADDRELMQLMVETNIQCVFVGVESPNAESLMETQKYQNLRDSGSMTEKIQRIQDAGMEVWTGMIAGFDHDDQSIFAAQCDFIREARVVHAMFGMLSAIPKTPLYERLLSEQRLDLADQPEFGTNVIPQGMSREALRDGYVAAMQSLYEPQAYFDRVDSLYHDLNFQFNKAERAYWKRHRFQWLAAQLKTLLRCAVLYRRLMRQVTDDELRSEYRRRLQAIWRQRRQPSALFVYLLKCATHYHYHRIAGSLSRSDRQLVNTF